MCDIFAFPRIFTSITSSISLEIYVNFFCIEIIPSLKCFIDGKLTVKESGLSLKHDCNLLHFIVINCSMDSPKILLAYEEESVEEIISLYKMQICK